MKNISKKVAEEAIDLINSGQKLMAIKFIKDKTGWGLRESKDWVDNPAIPTKKLKYLQDMTIEDYNKVIGDDGTDQYKQGKIDSFKSLAGFMIHIGEMGHFKSYPIAKSLGYDVEFILPIKK